MKAEQWLNRYLRASQVNRSVNNMEDPVYTEFLFRWDATMDKHGGIILTPEQQQHLVSSGLS